MSQVAEAATGRAVAAEGPPRGLELRQLTKEFASVHRRRSRSTSTCRRVVLRPARPVGLRQDHDAADGRGAGDADVGHDPARRARHHLRQALPAAGQHRLPELRAVPAPRHLRERRLRAASPQGAATSTTRSTEMLELVELDQPGPQEAGPALRWPAAAGRAGAGADQPARGAAARRAARRPRPQAAPSDADRAEADPDRGRPDVHPRHPRPGGGHDDGRHHRGDERRA